MGLQGREIFIATVPDESAARVPGLPIRACPGSSNNLVPGKFKASAIDMTAKTIFECLYFILGLRQFVPRVNCPYAPTPPPLTPQLFLDFCEFFSQVVSHFFGQHYSTSNLAGVLCLLQ